MAIAYLDVWQDYEVIGQHVGITTCEECKVAVAVEGNEDTV